MAGKIAIVDDEECILDVCRSLVEATGIDCKVLTYTSGEEFLENYHSENSFDLVFLDYSMPGKSGLDVLEEIRHSGSEVPVYLMSGWFTNEMRHKAEALGADYLPKPFGLKEILDCILSKIY